MDVDGRMGGNELTEQEVSELLARYDLARNPRLGAAYSIDKYPHIRRCAVLVPLFFFPKDGQLHVLLTQRAGTLRSHPGSVAFPGGRQDPTDVDDAHTALREAQEEVGLDPSQVRVIARVPPSFVRRANAVFPVVAFIPADFQASPNPSEVALVFSVPLHHFVDGYRISFNIIQMFDQNLRMPYLAHVLDDGTQTHVWGFTCVVCIAVARALLTPVTRYVPLVKKYSRASFYNLYVNALEVTAIGLPEDMLVMSDTNQRAWSRGESSSIAAPRDANTCDQGQTGRWFSEIKYMFGFPSSIDEKVEVERDACGRTQFEDVSELCLSRKCSHHVDVTKNTLAPPPAVHQAPSSFSTGLTPPTGAQAASCPSEKQQGEEDKGAGEVDHNLFGESEVFHTLCKASAPSSHL